MKTEQFTKKQITELIGNALDDFIKKYDGFDIDEYNFNEIFVEYLSIYIKDLDVCYAISNYIKIIFYDEDLDFGSDYDYAALTQMSNDILNDKN